MNPFDRRLLTVAGQTKYFLVATVLMAVLISVGTVGIAYTLSHFVVSVFIEQESVALAGNFLLAAVLFAAVRSLAQFSSEALGFRTARGLKERFRSEALRKVSASGSRSDSGTLSQLLGPGIYSLDNYFGKFLPQLVFTVVITPLLLLIIAFNDLISAVAILLTLPLIPIFLILIGLVTRDAQTAQLDASTALSSHFLEVMRGVTTLKIFGRIERQIGILRAVSDEQKRRTIKLLRLSFLSGFALELAGSLSVALVAVQIGLRLVDGTMLLSVGLFVLLLAPEVYLPLRNVGMHFHNSQDGVTATGQVLDLLQESVDASCVEPDPVEGITVLIGPSGAGKSRLMMSWIGDQSAWMSQRVHLFAGSVQENIGGFGVRDDTLIAQLLRDVGLDESIATKQVSANQGLSGGEAQRVCLARALYRLQTRQLTLLLLDEPTSMLDSGNQARIAQLLTDTRGRGVRIVIATHQTELIQLADRIVEVADVTAT